jgi:hypothetical protein
MMGSNSACTAPRTAAGALSGLLASKVQLGGLGQLGVPHPRRRLSGLVHTATVPRPAPPRQWH